MTCGVGWLCIELQDALFRSRRRDNGAAEVASQMRWPLGSVALSVYVPNRRGGCWRGLLSSSGAGWR